MNNCRLNYPTLRVSNARNNIDRINIKMHYSFMTPSENELRMNNSVFIKKKITWIIRGTVTFVENLR